MRKTRRTPLSALPLAALLLASACASTGSANAPERLAGCYYFLQDATAESLRLPWGVRLVDEPLDGWPALQQLEGVRLATTLTPEGDEDHPFGYWRPLEGDSVQIGYPAGGGLSLRLMPEPDLAHLEGIARPVGDVRPLDGDAAPGPTPVRLMRARCPEE